MKYSILAFALVFGLTACKSQQNSNDTTKQAPSQNERPQQSNGKQGPPSVDEIFKMDANGDGLLSKSEVKGPLLEQFDTIDSNGDGLLSKTEVQNAPKPQRGQGGQGGQGGPPPRN